jgi:hypothetical protein|tara:strand:- start:92 stop:460 length:369 start_codon:yes stop_codon:yes gene_type:complete
MNVRKLKELVFHRLKEGVGKRLFKDNAYYYKNICASERLGKIEIYDTTTSIYRPMKESEMKALLHEDVDEFCKKLKTINLQERFAGHRHRFHIAIAKQNEKEKKFFYKRCVSDIKQLRKVLY